MRKIRNFRNETPVSHGALRPEPFLARNKRVTRGRNETPVSHGALRSERVTW